VPVISAEYMKKEEKAAEKKGRIKRFWNFNLGHYYSAGVNELTRSLLAQRSRPFPAEVYDTDRWYLGVDQGDLLHWSLSRMYEGRRITVRFGMAHKFEEVYQLFDEYSIAGCVVDAMPNKHNARAMRDKFQGRVWMCYYHQDQPHEMKAALDKDEIIGTKNKEEFAINVDHTETLDKTTKEWVDGVALMNASPNLILNEHTPEGQWATQMMNLKRTEEEDKYGNMRGRWVKTGADHFRHADNYNRLAVDIIGRGEEGSGVMVGSASIAEFNGPLGRFEERSDGLLVPVMKRKD
jgi:hypothetical protein